MLMANSILFDSASKKGSRCPQYYFLGESIFFIAFMIFMPFVRLWSIISRVTAFFRWDRCSCRTQFGKARPFVSYLPLVKSLKKLVMTCALESPLLFRMMSRNSGNSILPEPSSSTS